MYPSNVSSFHLRLFESLCAEPPWSLPKVQTLSTDTHATLKQNFCLEHVYGVSNSDGEKKGKVVLLEFLSAGSKLIWYVGRVRRVTVAERKRWPIIGRTAMPMIFRLEAAFDHHPHLESKSLSWPLRLSSGYWLEF